MKQRVFVYEEGDSDRYVPVNTCPLGPDLNHAVLMVRHATLVR